MDDPERVTVPQVRARKGAKAKLTCLTAYDHAFARLVDEAGIDLILVGDSLGTVVQGKDSTLPVTLEEMLYHTEMVARAARRALVVGDMPFLSYQASRRDAVRNAGRFLKEGGADAVKLEGGVNAASTIRAMTKFDIPVMAHIGLTPQSIRALGRYQVQKERDRLLRDAEAVQKAGAFAVVLEAVPREIARELTGRLAIPTVGIGAGPDCDGQILVLHDLLGLTEAFKPKFVKRYAELGRSVLDSVRAYCADVKEGTFPSDEHSFHLSKLGDRRSQPKS